MSTDVRYLLKVRLFDKKLIEEGSWTDKEKKAIVEWNETSDPNKFQFEAAKLLTFLILNIMGKDCTSSGKVRIRRLGMDLDNLENILILTKNLEKKFYRDHLNHSIRVALLANAIAQKKPFELNKKELDHLVLACIFHDIAYPLSQIKKILSSTLDSIKNGYNIAQNIKTYQNIKLDIDNSKMEKILLHDNAIIEEKLKKFDHGLLSACEFITYLKDNKTCYEKYSKIINAISVHSNEFNNKVNSSTDQLLALLILSDELQDWGRPTTTGSSPISKLDPFILCDNQLSVRYNIENDYLYSPLRQIHGKYSNLRRLVLKDFKIQIVFPILHFDNFNINKFEEILQEIYNVVIELEPSLFLKTNYKEFYKEKSDAEKIYYGINIPVKWKQSLYEKLNNNTLVKNSVFMNKKIYVRKMSDEAMIIPDEFKDIEFIKLVTIDEKILIKITNDDEHYIKINGLSDNITKRYAYLLAGEIRFFNICMKKLAKFRNEKFPVEFGITGYPSKENVEIILKSTISRDFPQHQFLHDIMKSIETRGIYYFQKYT